MNFEVLITRGNSNTENQIDIIFNGINIHTYPGTDENSELFENVDGGDTKYYDLLFNIAVAGNFNGPPWSDMLTVAERRTSVLNNFSTWTGSAEMIIKNVTVTMEDIAS